jgi:branched-chain amino acid transport system substrate-binding protein
MKKWNDMPRRRKARAALWLAPPMAVLLVGSACASDEDAAVESQGDNTSETNDDACTELKIGVLVPLTGELGSYGTDWQNGIQLAVDEMSESGALPDGWTVSLVSGDEKANQEEGLRVARKMVDSDKVSVIIGPTSTSVVGMVGLAEQATTPIISASAGTVALDDLAGEWVYRAVPSDGTQGVATIKWLEELGTLDIGMLVQNDEATRSTGEVVKAGLEARGGGVIAEVAFNPGQPSYQAQLQEVLNADPETILVSGGEESGVTILREAFNAGYDGNVIVSSEMLVQNVIEGVGAERMEGAFGTSSQADTETPTYQAFHEAYVSAYDDEPERYTADAYDIAIMSGLAAIEAGSACGGDINTEFRNVSRDGEAVDNFADAVGLINDGVDVNYEGASGPINFDEKGSVADSFAVFEVQGGEWKQVEFFEADEIEEEIEAG